MMSYIAPVAAALGLLVAFGLASWIKKEDEGTDRMKEIASISNKRVQNYGSCSRCFVPSTWLWSK